MGEPMYQDIITTNREKFLKFNNIKLERFQSLIPNPHIKRILNSIPFFLCVNHEKVPGYVSGKVPVGVARCSLDDDTKRFLKGKFPTIKIDTAFPHYCVEMIAVMGSIGTIAYNKKSDFDYWVCIHKNTMTQEQYALFRKKVEAIQKWAESEIHLPLHIFVNDIESIRQNIYDEDEDEAFGSAIGALLKDEFFRSSIIVAGKVPFWWVVPQFATDMEYDQLYGQLPDEEREYFVDIGNLHRISKEDFMGAALFQIIKSLGNPFKSILKLGVLEKYLNAPDDEPLICQKVKTSVQRGNITNTFLDSYLMMFSEVYEYYEKTLEDKKLLGILKQNLYLKIDPQLGKYAALKDKKSIPYKVEEMFRYTQEWKWTDEIVKELDNFDNWDFTKVMRFWDNVQKFMLLSYQKIAIKFPTMNLKNKISDSDFKLLSRKIKSHFSREADKIDKFVTFKDTPCESLLYIEPVNQGIREVEWRLFKRNSAETRAFVATTIKTDPNLVKLLVWSAINGIYDPKFSRLTIQSGYTRINQNLVVDMLNQLCAFFTEKRMKIRNDFIVRPVFRLLNYVILNFNIGKADSIQQFTHVQYTSWGESFIKEYRSLDDLAKTLISILCDGMQLVRPFDEYCAISSPEPYVKLYKDIAGVFRESYVALVEKKPTGPSRFISKLGESYLVLTREGNDVSGEIFPHFPRLCTAFTLKPRKDIAYHVFDCDDQALRVLAQIMPGHDKNNITIFYEHKGEQTFAYCFNETGNLFIFTKPKSVAEQFIALLFGFSRTIAKRIKENNEFSLLTQDRVKVKSITTDRNGSLVIRDETQVIGDIYLSKYGYESAYVVQIKKGTAGDIAYKLIFPDKSETGFMHMKDFSMGAVKLEALKSVSRVRNFAQDIHFGEAAKAIKESSVYFLEKYKVEFVLNQMLSKK
jgi:adenylate cyclase class 1